VYDRAERVHGQHRGQRLAPEPDVRVGVVLEDREAVLGGQGQQGMPLDEGEGDPGRVLVVGDDVGELRAYSRLQQRTQLVDVDAVLAQGHLVHLGAPRPQAEQRPVVGRLLHHHRVARLDQVVEEERVGL
jgi:hypothetical protein